MLAFSLRPAAGRRADLQELGAGELWLSLLGSADSWPECHMVLPRDECSPLHSCSLLRNCLGARAVAGAGQAALCSTFPCVTMAASVPLKMPPHSLGTYVLLVPAHVNITDFLSLHASTGCWSWEEMGH